MASSDGELIGREVAFPPEIQGRWVEESDPDFEVIVDGSEISWRGVPMDYQSKRLTTHEEGWVYVEVEFADQMDSGDELNLVAWPTGEMHAFSDHFAACFVRPNA